MSTDRAGLRHHLMTVGMPPGRVAFRRRGGTASCDPAAIEIDDNFDSNLDAADERDVLLAKVVPALPGCGYPTVL